jgi:Epoxide hydrolase N terminus
LINNSQYTIFLIFIFCCSVVFLGFISSATAAQNVIGDNSEKKINYIHYKTNVNEIQLHYIMGGKGEGDPIVLLHGFPQT